MTYIHAVNGQRGSLTYIEHIRDVVLVIKGVPLVKRFVAIKRVENLGFQGGTFSDLVMLSESNGLYLTANIEVLQKYLFLYFSHVTWYWYELLIFHLDAVSRGILFQIW